MFNKIPLSLRITACLAVPVVLTAAIVFVISNSLQRHAAQAKDESLVFAGIAQQMRLDVVQIQQWLTDISATRAKDGLADGFDEAEKSYQSLMAGLAEFRTMYERENDTAGLQTVKDIETTVGDYYSVGKKMANAYIEGGAEAGNKTMGEFDGTASRLRACEKMPGARKGLTFIDNYAIMLSWNEI